MISRIRSMPRFDLLILVLGLVVGFLAIPTINKTLSPDSIPPGTSVSKLISAAEGGSLQLTDGTTLDIPSGALSTDTMVSIAVRSMPPNLGGLEQTQWVTYYEFEPNGTKFLKPVRLNLQYDNLNMSDALAQEAVVIARWDGKQWEYVGGTPNVTRKTITAEVTGFSGYAVIKLLSSNSLFDLVNRLIAKLAKGEPDPEWTNLANQIYVDPIKWIVVAERIKNVSSAGHRTIVADKDDFYKTFPIRAELPKSKRNLLDGATLGHEEAHDINGDSSFGLRRSFDLLVEIYKQAKSSQQQEKVLRLYFKYQLAVSIAYFTGDLEPLTNSIKEIGEALYTKLATATCLSYRDTEFRADHDGVSKASQTSPGWAARLGNEDVGVQVFLVFIRAFETAPSQQIEDDCYHPSGKERAQKLRELLPKDVGGIYGKVSGPTGVRLTANNGVWTETDAEGLYLLAPIPSGAQSLILSQAGCGLAKFASVPIQDLQKIDLDFNCVPTSASTATPFPTNTPYPTARPIPTNTPYPTATRVPPTVYVPPPTVYVPLSANFYASPDTINAGQCTTLYWHVVGNNPRYSSASIKLEDSSTVAPIPDGTRTVCPKSTVTYILYGVDNNDNNWERRVTVTVVPSAPPPPPTVYVPPPTAVPAPTINYFLAHGTTLNRGDCSSISWSVSNAREVYFNGSGVSGTGSFNACPTQTTTYSLRIVALDGSVINQTLTITVVQPPPQGSAPAAPSNLRYNNGVVYWNDNSNNEDGFTITIIRSSIQSKSFQVGANSTSLSQNSFSYCGSPTIQVVASNQWGTSSPATIKITSGPCVQAF